MKHGLRHQIAIYVLVAAVYGGVVHGGLRLLAHHGVSVAFWPASGVALGVLLLFGLRYWPAIVLGAFPVLYLHSFPLLPGSAMVAMNVGEAVLGAWILRKHTSFDNSLRRLSDVSSLLLVAVLLVPHVWTLVAHVLMCAGGIEPWKGFGTRWLLRWIGGATSVLVVVPWVLAGNPRRLFAALPWKRRGEGLALTATMLAAGIVFYGDWSLLRSNWPVGFLLYPLSIWVAFRFGLGGVTWLNLLAGSFVLWGTMNGRGLYALYGEAGGMGLAEAFVGVISGTDLILSAILAERKAIAENFSSSEKRYRELVERSPTLICTHAMDGTLLSVNAAALESLGYLPEEMVGRNFAGLLAPPVRHLFEDYLERIRERGADNGVLRLLTRDGKDCFLLYRNSVLREPGREPFVLGNAVDITDRMEARELLKRSERRYQRVVDHIREGLMVDDTEGRIVYANAEFLHLFGLNAEDVSTMAIEDYIAPEWRPVLRDRHSRQVRGEKVPATFEYEGLRKEGTRIWLEASVTLVVENGVIVGTQSAIRDITERKRSEEALRESETRYRDLVENATYGIFRATAEGKLLDVNPALGGILGYGFKEDLLAKNVIQDFFLEPAEGAAVLETALRTGRLDAQEALWKRKDGTTVAVHLAGRMARDVMGKPAVIEAIVENVTERRSLEEQLRQAQKMEAIGQLAGGVAHDFNNLVGVIIGYSEVILDRKSIDGRMRAMLEQVRKAGSSAASLTRQLLAFSRNQALEPRVIDLNILVSDTSKMLQRLIGEHVKLVIVSGAGLGWVKVDPGQIEQVIVNLAVNARDAMPDGGRLTIETTNAMLDENYAKSRVGVTPGPHVLLTISDTGMGMPPETLSRIFEPFFTTKKQGTGLGLATVYGIVQQSGGHLWVYSEVGHGTSFKIYLPRVQEEGPEAAEEEAKARPPRGTETVLLVEDAEHLRTVIREFLTRLGYSVVEAGSGSEALKLAKKHKSRIDLLLTDVVMPEMSGRHLWEQMSVLRPKTKILFMSGYTDDAIVHHGILQGGLSLLSKPFTQLSLARKVREVLDAGKQ